MPSATAKESKDWRWRLWVTVFIRQANLNFHEKPLHISPNTKKRSSRSPSVTRAVTSATLSMIFSGIYAQSITSNRSLAPLICAALVPIYVLLGSGPEISLLARLSHPMFLVGGEMYGSDSAETRNLLQCTTRLHYHNHVPLHISPRSLCLFEHG